MSKLMGLQFKIVNKKVKDNIASDALSRFSNEVALSAISEVQPTWIGEVINSYVSDTKAQEMLQQLAIKNHSEDGYSLHSGVIRKGFLTWIGNNTALHTKLIAACHASALGGHSGSQATYHRLRRMFIWKGLKADVDDFVKQCIVCQQAKHERTHPTSLLQPLPIHEGS